MSNVKEFYIDHATGKIEIELDDGSVSYFDMNAVVRKTANGSFVSSSGEEVLVKANVFTPQQFNPLAGRTNGVNDDTAALQWAIQQAALAVNGAVDLGAGVYRVTQPIGTLITTPISIYGAGAAQCWINIDASMTGDLLSFSNCWYGADTIVTPGGNVQGSVGTATGWPSKASRKHGVTLKGFSVVGTRTTTNTQNGIIFYDRNDAVYISDLDIQFIKGIGLCISGIASNSVNNPATVAREWVIHGLHVRWCGDSTTARPSVMFNSTSRGAESADDACNLCRMDAIKVIFSDGVAFQTVCHNVNVNQSSNNHLNIIFDSPQNLSYAYIGSNNSSITNGVLTILASGTQIGSFSVGQYVNNVSVPLGTYISAVLTGSGGAGTYQLSNRSTDISTLTVAQGSMGALRCQIPVMQIGGGHVGDDWDVTVNGSNSLGTNGAAIEFNQNILAANQPKTRQCRLKLSCGQIDTGLMLTCISSLKVELGIRLATTMITALTVNQGVTVDLGNELSDSRIAIGGDLTKVHVQTGAQKVVTALPQAIKYPNATFILNTAGTYTSHVSDGTNWIIL